ncbi:hypothetical protein ACFX1R_003020 [Malus domestica]
MELPQSSCLDLADFAAGLLNPEGPGVLQGVRLRRNSLRRLRRRRVLVADDLSFFGLVVILLRLSVRLGL